MMRCRITHSPEEAAAAIQAGRLVALPTETVYGLGANALDPLAVAKIFAAKERPEFDPLIVHLASAEWLPRVAAEFPDNARRLAEKFWPGPLTFVLPKTEAVPDLVTSGLSTVGVRVPDHPLTRRVLELADVPIAAPSANLFGRLSPTTVEHVLEQLGDRIDLVLDGGPCRVGVESTILHVAGGAATLLRPGGIGVEEIERVLGPIRIGDESAETVSLAPGRLPCHYAPRTPVRIVEAIPSLAAEDSAGILAFRQRPSAGYRAVEVLSERGDLAEAAANFFPALHRLDAARLRVIFAELFPEQGLGRALNDRLRRAAATDAQGGKPSRSNGIS